MARSTTIITSIVSGGKSSPESVTVSSTSWSTDSGTITLSAAVPATVNIGDVITDSSANKYLITGISGSDLTCQDFSTTTDPATGSATINSAYTTLTLWEADLDAGTNVEAYKSGDTAIGHVYNTEGAFNENLAINGGGTIGLVSVTLTVPEAERHDGTAGSGACIVRTGTNITTVVELFNQSTIPKEVSWLEFDVSGVTNVGQVLYCLSGGKYANNIVHGASSVGGFNSHGIYGRGLSTGQTVTVINNIVYDMEYTGIGSAGACLSLFSRVPGYYYNNTCHNYSATNASQTGNVYNINMLEFRSDNICKNNLSTDPSTAGSGSALCFRLGAGATNADYNASTDTSADDNSSSNNVMSISSSNQYVSTTGGSEDLHLKSGADVIDAGVDLATTPSGVQYDIDNRDRDAEGDTWDIGADEFVGGGGGPTQFVMINLD